MENFLEKICIKYGTFDSSIFKRLYLYYVDNYILYYDSLDTYKARIEPPRKRKLLYHITNLLFISMFIKFTLLLCSEDVSLKVMTGEVIFLHFTYYRRVYAFINFVLALITMLKLTIFYYEKNLIFRCNDIGQLKYHQHSFLILANIFYYGSKIIDLIVLYSCSLVFIIMYSIAYFNTKHKFNLINLIISIIQVIICFKFGISFIIGCFVFLFIILMFLKWKQDEIVKSIRFNLLWGNKIKLYDTLIVYHKFTVTVNKVSKLINIIIGMIYTMTPGMFSQAIMILNIQANNIEEMILQIIVIFVIPFYVILIFIVNHLGCTITTVNQSIPKYLYPVFNKKNFSRLNYQIGLNLNYNSGQLSNIMVHMKIDSFIARLNEEYVGFYCFNLFPFTKLSFFQYLYVFMTAYVLVNDI